MTDLFSKEQFEAALPVHNRTGLPLWESKGFIGGEYTYFVPVSEFAGIMIRSSVKEDGYSARSGKDSIRLWMVNPKTGKPVANKLKGEFIKRTPRWQERLVDQLRIYFRLGRFVRPCACGGTVRVGQSHKDNEMKGWMYAACDNHDCKSTRFAWVANPKGILLSERKAA